MSGRRCRTLNGRELHVEVRCVRHLTGLRPSGRAAVAEERADGSPQDSLSCRDAVRPSVGDRVLVGAAQRSRWNGVLPEECRGLEAATDTVFAFLSLDLADFPLRPDSVLLDGGGHPDGVLACRVAPLAVGVGMSGRRCRTLNGRELHVEVGRVRHLTGLRPSG